MSGGICFMSFYLLDELVIIAKVICVVFLCWIYRYYISFKLTSF